MPGAIAANAYEGVRSEVLAQYALSAFGTAARVPMSDDSGIDFHCTLGRLIGKRLLVENYYLVQVKSSKSTIQYNNTDAVRWLLSHKYPILFMVVDKQSSHLSIYKTTEIASIPWRALPNIIEIEFDGTNNYDPKNSSPSISINTGAPILDFNITQLADREWRNNAIETLRSWIELDQANIDWRTSGFDAYQFPSDYTPNKPIKSKMEMRGSFSALGSSTTSRLPSMVLFGLAQMANVAAAENDKEALMKINIAADHVLQRYKFMDNAPYYYAFCFNTACKHLSIDIEMTIDISNIGTFTPFGNIEN